MANTFAVDAVKNGTTPQESFNLRGADFTGSDLRRRRFPKHMNLSRTNFGRAVLRGAVLNECDLQDSDFQLCDLEQVELERANLRRSNFAGAIIKAARMKQSKLAGSVFTKANLERAFLQKADLRDADLRGANLRSVDLRGANLDGADLTDADMTGATVTGASFRRVALERTVLTNVSMFTARRVSARGGHPIDGLLPHQYVQGKCTKCKTEGSVRPTKFYVGSQDSKTSGRYGDGGVLSITSYDMLGSVTVECCERCIGQFFRRRLRLRGALLAVSTLLFALAGAYIVMVKGPNDMGPWWANLLSFIGVMATMFAFMATISTLTESLAYRFSDYRDPIEEHLRSFCWTGIADEFVKSVGQEERRKLDTKFSATTLSVRDTDRAFRCSLKIFTPTEYKNLSSSDRFWQFSVGHIVQSGLRASPLGGLACYLSVEPASPIRRRTT